jgi:hypothetical protein
MQPVSPLQHGDGAVGLEIGRCVGVASFAWATNCLHGESVDSARPTQQSKDGNKVKLGRT